MVDGKGVYVDGNSRYNNGYDGVGYENSDNSFGGVQNGVTDGRIMDGGIPGSPNYMP